MESSGLPMNLPRKRPCSASALLIVTAALNEKVAFSLLIGVPRGGDCNGNGSILTSRAAKLLESFSSVIVNTGLPSLSISS